MTSRKHAYFVDQPMGNKGVMAIPGIGPKFGAELRAINMHHVCFILIYHSIITIYRPLSSC